MPLTVSVSAFALKLFGASHWRPYHARIRSRACDSEIFSGSSDSGRNGVLDLLVRHERGRSAELAALADLVGSNTEIAWQL